MKRVVLFLAVIIALPAAALAAERSLLWRVVQACVATHSLTGASFPCLSVDLQNGPERGYAVVRAPFETTHVVVTPTVRTVGVEAARLREDGAPNYFADAWSARHFVADDIPRPPGRTDLALAVNSRLGRSQDQLHIHVDCVRQDVKRALVKEAPGLRAGTWTRATILPRAPRYASTVLSEADLAHTNVFRMVQQGLGITDSDMDGVTIVLVGADLQGAPGFVVLARQRIPHTRDEAHGEGLMDHACSAFR